MSAAETSSRLGHRARLLLGLCWFVLTGALFIALRTLPWEATVDQLRRVHLGWVFAAILAYLLPLVVWAKEWQLLSPRESRVPYARMFEIVATMAAVLNSVPFFAGEATGVALLVSRAGLSRGAALSVLAVDQLLGGLVKILVLCTVAAFVPLPQWLRTGVLTLLGGVLLLLVTLLLLAHRWRRMEAAVLGRGSRFRRALAGVTSWGEDLHVLRETGRAWRVGQLAVTKKFVELLAIVAVQMAFGLTPSLSAALLVLAAVAIAGMVPVAPANLGVYEAAVFASYHQTGLSTETALGLALVQHACFLVPMLTVGYVTLTVRQVRPRALAQSRAHTPARAPE